MKTLLVRHNIAYFHQLQKTLSLPKHPEWVSFVASFLESVPQYLRHSPTKQEGVTEVGFEKIVPVRDKTFLKQLQKSWVFFQNPTLFPNTIQTPMPSGAPFYLSYHVDKLHKKLFLLILQEDRPFIVETLRNVMQNLHIQCDEVFHPVFKVQRGDDRLLRHIQSSLEPTAKNAVYESLLSMTIQWDKDSHETQAFIKTLLSRFQQLHQATYDWPHMRKTIQTLFQKRQHPEWDYIDWLCQDHFLFLGMRYITPSSVKVRSLKQPQQPVVHHELGLFQDEEVAQHPSFQYKGWRPLHNDLLFKMTKTTFRSPINRSARVDMMEIWDEKNQRILQVMGVFTRKSYTQLKTSIPIIKSKVAHIFETFHLQPNWHDGKRLKTALESIPHDEYWYFPKEDLQEACATLLHAHPNSHPILLSTLSEDKTSITMVIFIGRERYSVSLKEKIGSFLEKSLHGALTSTRGIVDDAPFARMIFVVNQAKHFLSDTLLKEKGRQLQHALTSLSLTWEEHFLILKQQEKKLKSIHSIAFEEIYKKNHDVDVAFNDSLMFAQLKTQRPYKVVCRFSKTAFEKTFNTHLDVRLFSLDQPLPLASVIDVLKNAGIVVQQEHTYPIQIQSKKQNMQTVYVHHCLGHVTSHYLTHNILQKIEQLLCLVLEEKRPNDSFNQLIIGAKFSLRQIDLCRSYSEFMQQIGYAYSPDFFAKTLSNVPFLAHILLKIFDIRFSPSTALSKEMRLEKIEILKNKMDKYLEMVTSFEEDQLFRDFYTLIHATVRTNYYLKKDYISLKFASDLIPRLVEPKPLFEVFVSSALMKGVHLRSSKVARGGIRYSDRPQDVRNEVLQLMQAQTLKNAIIVPTGAKGGFIVKKQNPSKDDVFCAYTTLIQGLLDITDNYIESSLSPSLPRGIVAFDDLDPYLVVAADKGTATFSDGANAIAKTYDFWLKDAFASGGGYGYDHKKLGITARGAFVSVEHHFSKKGIDLHNDSFIVIGVGDMSGDVFGNGMLLSRKIALLGAFNHQHIFLDPFPNLEKSFEERHRLFHMPQSSWKDYNQNLLSKGGQIFERTQKIVTLSPENQDRFNLPEKMTPTDLIRSLLSYNADLLWFGGIGTYIQGDEEDYRGDPQNDAIRIRASEVQGKVIGEGANLGVTSLARIDLARRNVLLNSDAIDNAGGVNCSDREVNLKILLSTLPFNQRNEMLQSATQKVVELILKDNFNQNKTLDLLEETAASHHGDYCHLLGLLEANVPFKRRTVFLEKDEFLKDFRQNLTRPELSILMSYSKLWLKSYLRQNHSHLFEDTSPQGLPLFLMRGYFPKSIIESTPHLIAQHSLLKELCTLILSNHLIHKHGILWLIPVLKDKNDGQLHAYLQDLYHS